MDIQKLIGNLQTNWKDVLSQVAATHQDTINESLTDDQEKFHEILELCPPTPLIFNAFNHFNIEDLKVCIIGMDPYINVGEAMGLCFSVPDGVKCPPSLRNIFKEIEYEYGVTRKNTDLTDWAKQGVLLLNTSLTTLESKSGYHMKIWRLFTQDIIKYLGANHKNVVYMLWGAHAQQFEKLIDKKNNLVLKHSHPSPLSRKPFVGNNHFKMCNAYLTTKNIIEIKWF